MDHSIFDWEDLTRQQHCRYEKTAWFTQWNAPFRLENGLLLDLRWMYKPQYVLGYFRGYSYVAIHCDC